MLIGWNRHVETTKVVGAIRKSARRALEIIVVGDGGLRNCYQNWKDRSPRDRWVRGRQRTIIRIHIRTNIRVLVRMIVAEVIVIFLMLLPLNMRASLRLNRGLDTGLRIQEVGSPQVLSADLHSLKPTI